MVPVVLGAAAAPAPSQVGPLSTLFAPALVAPSRQSVRRSTRRIVIVSLCAGAVLGLVSLPWLPGPWNRPADPSAPPPATRPLAPSARSAYAATAPATLAPPVMAPPAAGPTAPALSPPSAPAAAAPSPAPAAPAASGASPAGEGAGKGARKARFAAQVLRAQELVDQGRIDEAERLYDTLLLEHPEHPAVRAGLGFCATERGRSKQAIEQYERALEIRPDYSPALIGLARIYRRSGDRAAALSMYQRYLEKHPDGARVPWARRQIAELGGSANLP